MTKRECVRKGETERDGERRRLCVCEWVAEREKERERERERA